MDQAIPRSITPAGQKKGSSVESNSWSTGSSHSVTSVSLARPWWQGRLRALLIACALVAGLLGCGKSSESARLALRTTTGETCHDGAVACGDACAQLSSSADHCGSCDNACPGGSICDRGHCRAEAEGCSGPALLCDRDCADTASDEAHCGSCDNRCPSDASCKAG